MTDLVELPRQITLCKAPNFTLQPPSSALARVMYAATTPRGIVRDTNRTSTKPLYSNAYLQAVNLIHIVRDAKIVRLEKLHAEILEKFETEQQRLTNHLTPNRLCRANYASAWGHLHYPHLDSYSAVNTQNVYRFMAGIKDPTIATLYKNELHTIKRLMRGRR